MGDVPTVLRFTVPGEPVAKERPRAIARVSRAGGKVTAFARMVTPPKTREYEERFRLIAQAAVSAARWMWSAKDRFHVVLKVYRTHDGLGGDLDNVIKACGDAGNGVLWKDDRYVRGIGAMLYQDAHRPRVEVEVRRIAQGAATHNSTIRAE